MSLELEYLCEVCPVPSLDSATRRAMSTLYRSTYDGASDDLFQHDLQQKDEVLLLHRDDAIVGFTTLKTYAHRWQGSAIRVLYSGDTVVHRDHWGQQALSFAWVRHLGVLARRHAGERLVWFLLVKGHRTYRYLHVFARSFFPGLDGGRHDLSDLCRSLGSERFPEHYNPGTGVVEFPASRGHLRSEFAEPRPDELGRPGVRYFLERNPGYREGHELACVCDVSEDNMKPLTLRLFREGLHACRTC